MIVQTKKQVRFVVAQVQVLVRVQVLDVGAACVESGTAVEIPCCRAASAGNVFVALGNGFVVGTGAAAVCGRTTGGPAVAGSAGVTTVGGPCG